MLSCGIHVAQLLEELTETEVVKEERENDMKIAKTYMGNIKERYCDTLRRDTCSDDNQNVGG